MHVLHSLLGYVALDVLKHRLSSVKYKILVLSGKGGVGKSTFTSLLARVLANENEQKNVMIFLFLVILCCEQSDNLFISYCF